MIYNAMAEIICIDGVVDHATTREEVEERLIKYWGETGAWVAAVAAGPADEPMRAVCTIDAAGVIFWEPEPVQG